MDSPARTVFVMVIASWALLSCSANSSSATEDRATTRWDSSDECLVTMPNGVVPPGETPDRAENVYGDGTIWVGLYGNLVFREQNATEPEYAVDLPSDGSLGTKWWWWREGDGQLVITGKRLDAPGGTLTASLQHAEGRSFVASRLVFSDPGCWEITASVDDHSLSFVTLVAVASE